MGNDITKRFASSLAAFDKARAEGPQPQFRPLAVAGPTQPEIDTGAIERKDLFFPWPKCGVCKRPVDHFAPEWIPGEGVRWEAACHGEKTTSFMSDDEFWAASKVDTMTVFGAPNLLADRGYQDRIDSTTILEILECAVNDKTVEMALANARMYLNGMKPCARSFLWDSLDVLV